MWACGTGGVGAGSGETGGVGGGTAVGWRWKKGLTGKRTSGRNMESADKYASHRRKRRILDALRVRMLAARKRKT
uniref:Uncharacterized protein n=1 Tax=Oryza sativa subsp. japonica TaxID=39947 RepID=Q6Z4K2_ORYSJ|nr:hypothetical protein [Oryza sativa Japonica Group]